MFRVRALLITFTALAILFGGTPAVLAQIIMLPPIEAEVSLKNFATPAGDDIEITDIQAGEPFSVKVWYEESFWFNPGHIKLCFKKDEVEVDADSGIVKKI